MRRNNLTIPFRLRDFDCFRRCQNTLRSRCVSHPICDEKNPTCDRSQFFRCFLLPAWLCQRCQSCWRYFQVPRDLLSRSSYASFPLKCHRALTVRCHRDLAPPHDGRGVFRHLDRMQLLSSSRENSFSQGIFCS